jgi:hypothetical protein
LSESEHHGVDLEHPAPVGAGYVVIDADLEHDGDAAVAVWQGNIGWYNRLPEMYRAFYLDSPHGRPILKLLRHQPSQTIVGTFGAGPRRILWRGREIRAAVLSHLCVMREHRSVKPAAMLQRAVVDACRDRFDVVYGLPSHMGAALGRLTGRKVGGQLIRHVKILRYQHYVGRFLPRPLAWLGGNLIDLACAARARLRRPRKKLAPHVEWADAVDPRMGPLWQQSPHGEGWTSIRDTPTLRWRFDRLPSTRRRYLLLSPNAGGALSAWFACDTNVRDPRMLAVNDFCSIDGVPAIDRSAIRALCRAARREGFHAIELRFTGSAAIHASWTAEGFVERSRQPLVVIWLNPELAGELEHALHITDIDNDG